MTFAWFDPNTIRRDFETSLRDFFYPQEFNPASVYPAESLVRWNNSVYRATSQSAFITPPNDPWVREGRALTLIYDNVDSVINENGSLKISIDWRQTSNESIGCMGGSLRSIEGVLMCWIFSPRSLGTGAGLVDGARLRRLLGLWRLVSDCGFQVRTYAVNGPRSYDFPGSSDFYAHVVTASLTAMERVPTLQEVPYWEIIPLPDSPTDPPEPVVTIIDGDFL